MRIFRTFSVVDIEVTAEISIANLNKYVHLLYACGYLEYTCRSRETSYLSHSRGTRFTLVNDTGPRNPQHIHDVVTRRDGLRDINTGKEVYVNAKRKRGRSAWATG